MSTLYKDNNRIKWFSPSLYSNNINSRGYRYYTGLIYNNSNYALKNFPLYNKGLNLFIFPPRPYCGAKIEFRAGNKLI